MISEFFNKKINTFKTQLQLLLEKKDVSADIKKIKFEIQTDLENLEDLRFGLPLQYPKKIETLFLRLAPFFEGGVLFANSLNTKGTFSPLRCFFEGQAVALKNKDKELQFEFPEIALSTIKKAISDEVIKDLGIEVTGIDAFLLAPHPDYRLLLFCSLSDPWRKLHLEKIQTQILMAVSDL